MPYGVSSTMWAQMSPEDQNQVINDYYAAQGGTAAAVPTIGGYVAPTAQQVTTALAGSGLSSADQTAVHSAYDKQYAPVSSTTGATQQGTASGGSPANPSWIYAVNMPSTYPDFAAMKAAGSGLVIADDDPNYAILVAGARQWGVPVAVNVAAHNGETPEAYAARVKAAQAIVPDKLVLDIESVGKGYAGSAGWQWSNQAAALLKPIVGSTSVAVSMEPNQADYNYAAYQHLSTGGNTQYWVQAYTGDMTSYDATAATAPARAAVGDANVVAIFPPNVPPPTNYTGGYVSYGIPQTGVSSAGVYGTAPTSTTLGLTPVGGNTTPGTGPGPSIPGEIPETGPTPPGSPAPPGSGLPGAPPPPTLPGTSDGTGTTTPAGTSNWAAAYFGSFGLPADVASEVNDIFNKTPDSDQAIQLALAYIRGTPWYQQTFPGIQYGMQHGLVTNEQDYRQYVTALDTLTQRYLGRHVTGYEVSSRLFYGETPDLVGKQFEGQANLEANVRDYQYYLGGFSDQKNLDTDAYRALSNEQVGLDSPMGQKLNKALQQAMQRYSTLFSANAATPSLSLGKTGLSAPSLAGGKTTPDVGA
jgi:hypothetical protein